MGGLQRSRLRISRNWLAQAAIRTALTVPTPPTIRIIFLELNSPISHIRGSPSACCRAALMLDIVDQDAAARFEQGRARRLLRVRPGFTLAARGGLFFEFRGAPNDSSAHQGLAPHR